ncbi:MAG: zinc-binding alcohol dehydrogenase [Phaeodactylibacter sp.]|uniref:zinc-dependent alcohol dehydrogenase n=1 Tax=Phaeodactylibacter sp. TaxID=1940289 RepID=UPI0032EFD513
MPQALWHLSDNESAVQPVALSEKGLLVRALYSLVSTGTERLVATGGVPVALHTSMRVPGMAGHFSFPLTYGYSWVGKVDAPGHELHQQLVHTLWPHQTELKAPAEGLFPLPDAVPPLRATLASNMETVVNAIWDSGISLGDRALVVGFGMIGGLLSRTLSRMPGVQVQLAETHAQRQAQLAEMGFENWDGQPVDVAFHTTANGAGLQQAVDAVGTEGKIMELSWYGEREATVRLGGDFHYGRKQIISSQVANLPSDRRARWDFHRRKALVMDLLKDPAYDAHITQVLPFEEAPAFFEQLRSGAMPPLGTAFDYSPKK